jgi:aspartate kinase
LAAYLNREGIAARAADAFDVGLRTDSSFGRARPLPDDGRIRRALSAFEGEVPVITGYIAKDSAGNITTLGRNGSDYSAALFGNAVEAEEIQIWTDVDGVMTADPSLVRNARRIEVMSFDEASELAYYGGKVLHPATILPAMEKAIPVRVLNTGRPDAPGTTILPSFDDRGHPVRSIVYKEGIHLISVVNPRMLQQPGYLARVFGIAAQHEVDVGLVATSEVSVTMTTDCTDRIAAFADDLESCGRVLVEADQALVCVVGHGIATTSGIASRVLDTLAKEHVRVRVISQGAIKVNVALVVSDKDVPRAVPALHETFFE